MYKPLPSVTTVRGSRVSTFVAVTVAPGMTPPVSSLTTPLIWVRSNWARAGTAESIRTVTQASPIRCRAGTSRSICPPPTPRIACNRLQKGASYIRASLRSRCEIPEWAHQMCNRTTAPKIRSARPGTVSPTLSDCPCSSVDQHQLADVLARLQQAVRVGGAGEWKRPEHYGLDRARFEERPDVGMDGAGNRPLLHHRPGTQRRSGNGQTSLHDDGDDEFSLRAALRGNLDQPALDRERIEVAGEVLRADHVEDHVDAAAAGQLAHDGNKVGLAIVDRALGTKLLARGALGRRSGGREHARSPRPCQLNGGGPDAARSSVHQERLAGGQTSALEHVGPDSKERLRNGRGGGEIDATRDRQALRRRRHAVLGVAAARYQRTHGLAFPPAARLRPDRGNRPGHFQARNVRRPRRRRIPALTLHHIGPIDARGRDFDQDVAASRVWTRALHRDEHVRLAGLSNLNGDHGCRSFFPLCPLSPLCPRTRQSSPNAAAVVAGSSRMAASAMPSPRLSANTAHSARTLETIRLSAASRAANSRSSRTAARRVRRSSSIRCPRLCHSVKTRWPRRTAPIVAPAPSAMKIATVNGVSIHHSLINQPSTAAATYSAETTS